MAKLWFPINNFWRDATFSFKFHRGVKHHIETGQVQIWRSVANFWLSYGPFWLRFRLIQKQYWHFCGINDTFLHNFYIWKLLTIGDDYPVPVDMYGSDFYPTHDPLDGVKGQIFNYATYVYIFTEMSHADRGTINMKHIKRDFWSKTS